MTDEAAILIIATSIILLIAFYILTYISRRKKINKIKEGVQIVNVKKQTPLPIYRNTLLWAFFEFLILGGFAYFLHANLFQEYFPYYMIIPFMCILMFFYKFGYQKTLYLLKSNANVVDYCDDIQDFTAVNSLHLHLRESVSTHFSKKNSEKIVFSNGIDIWSCYAIEHGNESSYPLNIIFSTTTYNSNNDLYINLNSCMSSNKHNKDELFISEYGNLLPFIATNDNSKKVCHNIEKICSDFFAKTRGRYVLIISNGTIGLALNQAKFGKYKRLFSKDKTKKLTEEAVNEISTFLMQIKDVVEKST